MLIMFPEATPALTARDSFKYFFLFLILATVRRSRKTSLSKPTMITLAEMKISPKVIQFVDQEL